MTSIRHVASGFNVAEAVKQLDAHPEVWNLHRQRTEMYGTPHNGVSDVWVRYRDWAEYTGDWQAFHEEHTSVWYPCVAVLPAVWSLARKVKRHVGAKTLGGVLVTKIPPGGRVEPHVDGGWHASHYEKFAVQLKGNDRQAFCFEDSELRAEPGDLYTFDNSKLHWVVNDSDSERMTLIVCVR
jgi:quercetin dioxygenase-like cupin family protein